MTWAARCSYNVLTLTRCAAASVAGRMPRTGRTVDPGQAHPNRTVQRSSWAATLLCRKHRSDDRKREGRAKAKSRFGAAGLIHWPKAASVASPAGFPTTASKITAIVASAAVRLAST